MPHKKKLTSLSVSVQLIERRIYLIRGQKVMIDFDLAELYGVPTKRLNERVARNKKRFPGDFMFRLNKKEAESLRSQNAISNPDLRSQFATSSSAHGGRRYLPYVFTEQGVAMLSSVLNSEQAIEVNIAIMRAFVRLRQMLETNEELNRKFEVDGLKPRSISRQPATARNSVPFRNHFLSLSTDTCRLMVAKSWPGTSSLRQRIMSVTAKPSLL